MVHPWGRGVPDIARIVAGLRVVPSGVLILDTFFGDTGSHPAHFLPGQVVGGGPWYVNRAIFEEIEPEGPLAEAWNIWQRVLALHPSRYNEDAIQAVLKSHGEYLGVWPQVLDS